MIDYKRIIESISSLMIEVDLAGNCKNLIQTNSNLFQSFVDYYNTNPNRNLIDNYILYDKHKKVIQEALADKNIKHKLFKYVEINCNSQNKRYFFNIILNRDLSDDNKIYVILTNVTEYLNNNLNNLNESQFLHCLEYANIIVLIVNSDTNIVYFNKNLTDIFGYTSNEVYNINFLKNILTESDYLKVKDLCDKRFSGYKDEECYTIQIKTKDNSVKLLEIVSYAVVWDNQPASLVFLWDISKNINLYRYIFENTPRAIEICSKDGTILDINPAAENLWKISRKDVVNKVNIFELYRINSNPILYKALKSCVETKTPTFLSDYKAYVDNVISRDIKWLSTISYPILDSRGEVTHFVISNDDLTKKKKREHERELLYQDLIDKQKIFETLTTITYNLLQCNEEDALQTVVDLIGETINVSRSYIFQAEKCQDSDDYKIYYKYEWCNHNVISFLNDPNLNGTTFKELGFDRWLEEFLNGHYILFNDVNKTPNSEQLLLKSQGIKSLLALPIFESNNNFWGFIGFDDCNTNRNWREHEISVLKTLANTIGSYVRRCVFEKRQHKFIYDQSIVLNNIDAYVWFFRDKKTYGFVNEAFYRDFIRKDASYQDDCLLLDCKIVEESQQQIETNIHVLNTKKTLIYEQYLTNVEGERRLLRIKKIPVLDHAAVKYIVCIANDITQHYINQEQLLKEIQNKLENNISLLNNNIEKVQKQVTESTKYILSTLQ